MTQSVRQSKLFAAEDFTAVYDSYINANFQAYDYATIRSTMIDYVREKYPENYNDWIESSEFVALLDLIAQFGHNLAFRADLNTRNNFLSTAQRQDSVFKLAEFLGYQPRRNVTAFGELKVVSVKTNETVIGSDGTTLAGKEIRYESTSNINNLDDFITVINAAFSSGNQFGTPRINIKISGQTVEYYNLNTLNDQIKFSIQGIAAGSSSSFDVIGLGYDSQYSSIVESIPNPTSAFTMIYKNDGKGVGSNTSGFFCGFKQGSLQYKDFIIDSPISNLSLDVDVPNINNSDVWVQSIDGNGNVISQWTKVDSVFGQNEIFNDIKAGTNEIFAVKTRENNQISVMFTDENFGTIPKNIIRVWYRTSENISYTLRPDDISNKTININYSGADGNTYTMIVGLQLKSPVVNASSSETLDTIKTNAPRNYVTQDRMITADDYNNYLLNQSENILKIKSVNRTHSGHSRYAKLYDPTGTYSNLHLFGTDGVLTRDSTATKIEHTDDIVAESVFENYLKPAIQNHELLNLYYSGFKGAFELLRSNISSVTPADVVFNWQTNDKTTGYFVDSSLVIKGVGISQTHYLKYITVGALVKFTAVVDEVLTVYWAKVSSIFANGRGIDDAQGEPSGLTITGIGAIAFDIEIPNNASLDMIYPAFAKQFTTSEKTNILSALTNGQSFYLKYVYDAANFSTPRQAGWQVISPVPAVEPTSPLDFLIKVTPTIIGSGVINNSYDITTRISRYEISTNQIEFTNLTNEYNINEFTKKRNRDIIELYDTVTEKFIRFYVWGYNIDSNGLYQSNKVIVALVDSSIDSRADNPDAYFNIAGTRLTTPSLRFEWTHIPAENEIIDPSLSNIIDIFTLTRDYNNTFKTWLSESRVLSTKPSPPTIDELNRQFNQSSVVDKKKAMSDTIIYRPVKYKVLFGSAADPEMRSRFNVIKVPGNNLTDTDIKTKVIAAINDFFDIGLWDFGETFYFTELAAYVHNELMGVISSFVIVPESSTSVFGSLFQITPLTDELFIPDATVKDIDIVTSITKANIKAN
tara:strand:- start:5796 stop:8906 length:3111 start_codon:yes stop_codon:yes gene_type:complete